MKLQSRTKLLEKVFPIMSTFLRNTTISKTTPLRKENPFPQFNVASHRLPGIRLSFKYTTTLLWGEGGEGRTGRATMFRKMLSKYTIFSTVLSKIVVWSRLTATLGILKIQFEATLSLYRFIIYLNHTREGASKTRSPLKYPRTIPNGIPGTVTLSMKFILPPVSVE